MWGFDQCLMLSVGGDVGMVPCRPLHILLFATPLTQPLKFEGKGLNYHSPKIFMSFQCTLEGASGNPLARGNAEIRILGRPLRNIWVLFRVDGIMMDSAKILAEVTSAEFCAQNLSCQNRKRARRSL